MKCAKPFTTRLQVLKENLNNKESLDRASRKARRDAEILENENEMFSNSFYGSEKLNVKKSNS